jgi:hypothetical protein
MRRIDSGLGTQNYLHWIRDDRKERTLIDGLIFWACSHILITRLTILGGIMAPHA